MQANGRLARVLAAAVLLGSLAAVLTGCWDRLEIEERAVVLGIAVDAIGSEDIGNGNEVTHLQSAFPHPGNQRRIRITVQIAVPGRIPLGPGEGGGGTGGGGGKRTVWTMKSEGSTIDDALMVMQQKLADRLFFGHLRIIVISEEVARRGVQNINDYFRRSPDVRRLVWMVVSKGDASNVMRAAPELERVPALYFSTMMDHTVQMGRLPNDFVGIFWSADSAKGQEPYLPYVQLTRRGSVELSGLAYFRGHQMVGATKPLEIAMFMAVLGVKTGGYDAYEYVPGSSETIMYRATYRNSHIKVTMDNGRPRIHVNIQVEGNIREKSTTAVEVAHDKVIQKLQKELSQSSKDGIERLIRKLQKDGSDIFGFGEYVRAKEPAYWNKNIGSEEKWQEAFKTLAVDVNVTLKIRRTGMTAR
jgi:spore germination protein KC